MMRIRMGLGLVASSLVLAPATQAAPASPAHPAYEITKSITIGGPNRWDYLLYDAPSHRLYVSHGSELTVVDARSGRLIGTVKGMPGGSHGIGISHATGQGFTDDGKAGQAVVFSLKTLKVTRRIKARPDADGIAVDPLTGHVFVIDGDSGTVTVIDPRTDKVIATIDGGGKLEFGAADGRGHFFVNGTEKHEIVRIDTRTNAVDARWPMPGCEHPHGLAVDAVHARVFSTCSNQRMEVLNGRTGKILATLPIGKGSDAARFDPRRDLAFSSSFEGDISVIAERGPDRFVAEAPIRTELGARTMALAPKSGRIFLTTADIAINKAAAPHDWRHRYHIEPGSVRLLFVDPVKVAGH